MHVPIFPVDLDLSLAPQKFNIKEGYQCHGAINTNRIVRERKKRSRQIFHLYTQHSTHNTCVFFSLHCYIFNLWLGKSGLTSAKGASGAWNKDAAAAAAHTCTITFDGFLPMSPQSTVIIFFMARHHHHNIHAGEKGALCMKLPCGVGEGRLCLLSLRFTPWSPAVQDSTSAIFVFDFWVYYTQQDRCCRNTHAREYKRPREMVGCLNERESERRIPPMPSLFYVCADTDYIQRPPVLVVDK